MHMAHPLLQMETVKVEQLCPGKDGKSATYFTHQELAPKVQGLFQQSSSWSTDVNLYNYSHKMALRDRDWLNPCNPNVLSLEKPTRQAMLHSP